MINGAQFMVGVTRIAAFSVVKVSDHIRGRTLLTSGRLEMTQLNKSIV